MTRRLSLPRRSLSAAEGFIELAKKEEPITMVEPGIVADVDLANGACTIPDGDVLWGASASQNPGLFGHARWHNFKVKRQGWWSRPRHIFKVL